MSENKLLYNKIAAIRPPADLKPGALMVAILRPEKTPEDVIEDIDIVWIKCPRNRSVSTVLGAFKQRSSETAQLRLVQSSHVLDESHLVASLVEEDRLCVIEAIRERDLRQRLNPETNAKITSPLRDITKNANNRPATLSLSQEKKNIPSGKKEDSSQHDDSQSTSAPSKSTLPSITSVFGTRDAGPAGKVECIPPVLLAWNDFCFERQEFFLRTQSLWPRRGETRYGTNISPEWLDLTPEQRQYFLDRARKLDVQDTQEHRAFWKFYYSNIGNDLPAVDDMKAKFRQDVQLFNKLAHDWKLLDQPSRKEYCARVAGSFGVPPLPTNSTLPVSHSRSAQSPATQSQPTSKHSQPVSSNTPTPGVQPSAIIPSPGANDAEDEIAESLRLEDSMPAKLNISQLFDGLSTEQLESGVAKGVEILSSIKETLQTEKSADSDQWLSLISNVEKQATKTKTIIGVVGATGAGKSSVINASLDQERLLPTNCMRACTAVVTEISYNHEEIAFRAEIDFINEGDWLKELKTSFDDLFDGSGKVSRECNNEDSEAGVAYAKIKAVYPLMTKENMETTTIEKLMKHSNVKNLLGSSRTIEHEDSAVFYKMLQKYVDSKEKLGSREKKTELEKAKAREMEFWPLIRVVRIYVKAPALATGAVIVDLPGVHDSNQARAAVAQGYLKQCTGLWIVAPITRAVDDKSAKTLLGDTFKRQLKMDGGYNSVTFICSKTDDISITEAQDSLGLDDEVAPLYTRSEELRNKLHSLKDELENLRSTKLDIAAVADSADEQLEVWEKLEEDLESGKTVYTPRPKDESKKRKRSGSADSAPRKKSKYVELSDDDDFVDDDESDAVSNHSNDKSDDEDLGEPLTSDIIAQKIQELKTTKKEARHERSQLVEKIKELRLQISEITKEQDEIDSELSGKCIKGRNEYSRGAIQQDFAAGIRELDQEIAEEEDAANFNPEVDTRDYDEVAKSLPVFCVSSRGYQKLQGRLKKDKGLSSFRNIEETEVPALQAHCTKLTITNREAACKRFLNSLSHLLNSLRLWSSSDGSGANLTDGQLKREAELLRSNMSRLDTDLEKEVKAVLNSFKLELQDHLFNTFPQAVSTARQEAENIQARWGAPVDRQSRPAGGLYWATYKAVVRRDGTYSENHFNDDLIEPVIKKITPGWEKVFSRRLPQVLSSIANNCHKIMVNFHNDVQRRAIKNGTSLATFQMLLQQLSTYRETVKDLADTTRQFIVTKQKDINREFVPTVMQAMLPAYSIATAERGTGSYKRMKEAVAQHVDQVRRTMYQESVDHVQNLLEDMLDKTEEIMFAKIDEILSSMKRDYESVVLGEKHRSSSNQLLPRQQRTIRKEVLSIVEDVEHTMKQVIDPEPVEEPVSIPESETAAEEANVSQDVKMEDGDSNIEHVDIDKTITGDNAILEDAKSADNAIDVDDKSNDELDGKDVKVDDSVINKDVKIDNELQAIKDKEETRPSKSPVPIPQHNPEMFKAEMDVDEIHKAAEKVDEVVRIGTSSNSPRTDSDDNSDNDVTTHESKEKSVNSSADNSGDDSVNESYPSSPNHDYSEDDDDSDSSKYDSDD